MSAGRFAWDTAALGSQALLNSENHFSSSSNPIYQNLFSIIRIISPSKKVAALVIPYQYLNSFPKRINADHLYDYCEYEIAKIHHRFSRHRAHTAIAEEVRIVAVAAAMNKAVDAAANAAGTRAVFARVTWAAIVRQKIEASDATLTKTLGATKSSGP